VIIDIPDINDILLTRHTLDVLLFKDIRISSAKLSAYNLQYDKDRTLETKTHVSEAMLKSVVDAAKDDAGIALAGFEKFKIQDRPECKGCNLAPGEEITLAPSRKLPFSSLQGIKGRAERIVAEIRTDLTARCVTSLPIDEAIQTEKDGDALGAPPSLGRKRPAVRLNDTAETNLHSWSSIASVLCAATVNGCNRALRPACRGSWPDPHPTHAKDQAALA